MPVTNQDIKNQQALIASKRLTEAQKKAQYMTASRDTQAAVSDLDVMTAQQRADDAAAAAAAEAEVES